jgi:hypothetical protein
MTTGTRGYKERRQQWMNSSKVLYFHTFSQFLLTLCLLSCMSRCPLVLSLYFLLLFLLFTVPLLTVPLLTVPLLTDPLLTVPLLIVSLLTFPLRTVALLTVPFLTKGSLRCGTISWAPALTTMGLWSPRSYLLEYLRGL